MSSSVLNTLTLNDPHLVDLVALLLLTKSNYNKMLLADHDRFMKILPYLADDLSFIKELESFIISSICNSSEASK